MTPAALLRRIGALVALVGLLAWIGAQPPLAPQGGPEQVQLQARQAALLPLAAKPMAPKSADRGTGGPVLLPAPAAAPAAPAAWHPTSAAARRPTPAQWARPAAWPRAPPVLRS